MWLYSLLNVKEDSSSEIEMPCIMAIGSKFVVENVSDGYQTFPTKTYEVKDYMLVQSHGDEELLWVMCESVDDEMNRLSIIRNCKLNDIL